eukprot:g18034.t1
MLRVKVLEQEIRSLRADAWGEAPLEEARHGLNDPMNGDRETPSRMEIFPSPSNPSPASQAESYCSAVRREHELEGAQSTGRQSQELLREMRRLRQQMNELEKVAAGREHPETSFGEGVLSPQNAEPQAINPAPTSLKRLPKTSLSEDPLSGWEYRAKPDDPVDAAVAELVNSRYRAWRALLCRLEQGVYLCGTRRVRIPSEKPKLPEKSEKAQTKRKMEPIPLAQLAQTMAEQRAKMSRGDGGSAAPVLAKKMPTPPPKVVVDLEDADS